MDIIGTIRQRSREQYVALVREKLIATRIWLQENGEKALMLGLLAGVVIVTLFVVVFYVIVIAAIIAATIWAIARPEGAQPPTMTNSDETNL